MKRGPYKPKVSIRGFSPFALEMGKRLNMARIRANLTQHELERLTEINHATISHLELGRHSGRTETVATLAKTLNVSIDWLCFGAEPEQTRANAKESTIDRTP